MFLFIGRTIEYLRSINYIASLLVYSALVSLLFSVIIMVTVNDDSHDGPYTVTGVNGTEPVNSIGFTDALFLCVSAYSASGLSTVQYWNYSTGALVVLTLCIEAGSIVLLTMLPALLRYRALRVERRKLLQILKDTMTFPGNFGTFVGTSRESTGSVSPRSYSPVTSGALEPSTSMLSPGRDSKNRRMSDRRLTHEFVNAAPMSPGRASPPPGTGTFDSANEKAARHENGINDPLLPARPTSPPMEPMYTIPIGQRIVFEDGLANVNQQIDICMIIIFGCVFYWFMVHLVFTLLVWVRRPFWWSLFHVISAFNNAGFALSPSNMEPISNDNYLMLLFTIIMPLGNTLFPVFFRFQTSLLRRFLRRVMNYKNGKYAETIVFGQSVQVWQHSVRLFLRHPRFYFTHMFSKRNTLILFLMWLFLTCVGFCMFLPFFHHNIFPDTATTWDKIVISLFQTVTVRTTGFSAMNLDLVVLGQLAWWVMAMYLSAYPFIITERISSNQDMDEENTVGDLRQEATNVVGRDLLWLYMAIVVVSFCERGTLPDTKRAEQEDYALFLRTAFEISSAFGNVGLSLPLNGFSVSFSGQLQSTLSLLVVILTMYCGKHRGLPRSVDAAISIHVRKYVLVDDAHGGGGAAVSNSSRLIENNSITKVDVEDFVNNSLCTTPNFREDGTTILNGSSMATRSSQGSAKSNSNGRDEEPVSPLRRQTTFRFEDIKNTKPADHGVQNTSQLVDMDEAAFRHRVGRFYAHYNPARLAHMDRIIEAFRDNPQALLINLAATYGPEPGANSKTKVSPEFAEVRLGKDAAAGEDKVAPSHEGKDERQL